MIRIHLYDLVQSRGWTQRGLSMETSIRESTISDMCNNESKMLGIENLNKICTALNCKVEDILEFIPNKKEG